MGHRRYKRKGKKTKQNSPRKGKQSMWFSGCGWTELIRRGRRLTKPIPFTPFTPSSYFTSKSAEVNGQPEEIEQVTDPMFNVVTHDTPSGWANNNVTRT